jgi:hypothetical protein
MPNEADPAASPVAGITNVAGSITVRTPDFVASSQTGRSRTWELTLLATQIGLAALIGIVVLPLQSKITSAVERETAELSVRLAISHEFYQRRLAAYEEIHISALDVVDAVRLAQVVSRPVSRLAETARVLFSSSQRHSLYLTENMRALSARLWRDALDIARAGRATPSQAAAVAELASEIDEQMAQDLHVPTVGSFVSMR